MWTPCPRTTQVSKLSIHTHRPVAELSHGSFRLSVLSMKVGAVVSYPVTCLYGYADGTYFNVIYNGESCKMPILAIIAINPKGEKELLGFTVGDKENQHAWEDLLADLKARGLTQVDLWITDGHQAMINAIKRQFPESKRQRCVVHKMELSLIHI